ncbi:MAG: two-component system response regulator [Proteobacteria bacterium]|nr:MAG: two-component system response regulator [Pseudomonadota bacterium]
MPKILLLEDDVTLNETIKEFLEDNSYEVVCVYDGEEAQDKLYEENVDLMLLDVNVPHINGFKLLRQERDRGSKVPAIFITSMDSVDDVEKGFLSGGNDYIRKPFSLKELLLRIENLIKQKLKDVYEISEHIRFDKTQNTLYVNSDKFILQNKESLLLKLFCEQKGKIVPHSLILDTLWKYDEMPSDGALRTYIKNLRKHLGKKSIVSFKKLGYKFTP